MLCAKLLRHTLAAGAVLPPVRATVRIIETYGTTLRWVLGHQPATLLVAMATLALTMLLYMVVPKAFPGQDTGVIQGISEAPQSISFPAMATRQQAWPR